MPFTRLESPLLSNRVNYQLEYTYFGDTGQARLQGIEASASVVIQKSLSIPCHSGLDPDSSVSRLDSRRSLPRT